LGRTPQAEYREPKRLTKEKETRPLLHPILNWHSLHDPHTHMVRYDRFVGESGGKDRNDVRIKHYDHFG
jgi:hypothetical protein